MTFPNFDFDLPEAPNEDELNGTTWKDARMAAAKAYLDADPDNFRDRHEFEQHVYRYARMPLWAGDTSRAVRYKQIVQLHLSNMARAQRIIENQN